MPLLTIDNLPGASFDVPVGPATLLAALQGAGFDWMHACGGRGRCTSCRVQIVSGSENLSPHSAAETRYFRAGRLQDDERLTCQAHLLAGPVHGRVPAATQLPHLRYEQ